MINERTCWEVTCDTQGCEPWDEDGGIPHSPTRQEAIDYAASRGFVFGNRTLCEMCAKRADCEATGHRWGDWLPSSAHGVDFHRRYCEHCGETETDRPFEELAVLVDVARIVDGEGAGAP